MEQRIEIGTQEYKELLKCKCDLEMVRDVLAAGARLSFDKRHLGLDAGTADTILHYMLGELYKQTIESLSKENLS